MIAGSSCALPGTSTVVICLSPDAPWETTLQNATSG